MHPDIARGIAKNYCSLGCIQVLQIPTYARMGGVGLNIDRFISIGYKLTLIIHSNNHEIYGDYLIVSSYFS